MSINGCTTDLVEPFALRVLGDSMLPEFEDGAVIIVDQQAPCGSGAYAVIEYNGDISFSQYVEKDGRRFLKPLNTTYPTVELTGKYKVHGVVIQKYYKRKRKHYDWVS